MAIEGCCQGRHSTVKKGAAAALGGQDVRAAAGGGGPSGTAGATTSSTTPQRVDAPVTAAAQIEALRAALVAGGVDGAKFDAAQQRLATAAGSDDDAVLAGLVELLDGALA
jgi:hypothetical protein